MKTIFYKPNKADEFIQPLQVKGQHMITYLLSNEEGIHEAIGVYTIDGHVCSDQYESVLDLISVSQPAVTTCDDNQHIVVKSRLETGLVRFTAYKLLENAPWLEKVTRVDPNLGEECRLMAASHLYKDVFFFSIEDGDSLNTELRHFVAKGIETGIVVEHVFDPGSRVEYVTPKGNAYSGPYLFRVDRPTGDKQEPMRSHLLCVHADHLFVEDGLGSSEPVQVQGLDRAFSIESIGLDDQGIHMVVSGDHHGKRLQVEKNLRAGREHVTPIEPYQQLQSFASGLFLADQLPNKISLHHLKMNDFLSIKMDQASSLEEVTKTYAITGSLMESGYEVYRTEDGKHVDHIDGQGIHYLPDSDTLVVIQQD